MYPLSRTVIRLVSQLTLALFLFGQLVFAVQACGVPEMSPATAIQAQASAESTGHPCEDSNDTLCLAQCLQRDETIDSHPAVLSNPPVAALVTTAFVSELPNFETQCPQQTSHFGPPFYIQVCRLLL